MLYGSVASSVSSVSTKPDRFLSFLWELRSLQDLRIIQIRLKHERTLSEEESPSVLWMACCFFQNVTTCVAPVLGIVAQYFVVAASGHVLCRAQRLACPDASVSAKSSVQSEWAVETSPPSYSVFQHYWTICAQQTEIHQLTREIFKENE